MTYEEFIEAFKARAESELSYDPALMKFYPQGYTSDDPKIFEFIQDTNKKFSGDEASPWLTKDILLLTCKDKSGAELSQRIAIRDVYDDAQKEGFDAMFDEVRKSQPDPDVIDMERVNKRSSAEYDDMKAQLIIRPLNYGLHMSDLRGCVYERVGDFALVLYQLLGDAEHSIASSKIMREELERWGMSSRKDEVMRDALANTARLYPACVFDNRGAETPDDEKEADFLTGEFERKDITIDGKYIFLSTFRVTNGAVSLFYPGVVEKMMSITGGPFWAVFMNINDVLIFETGDKSAENYAKVARVGGGRAEMLSVRVYRCDKNGISPV
ncbi:MAG: hypothetical protein IJP89_09265 [Synergistaceae bacterium]|nr:hypothetical protein [Synergistaceae bacterium]